MFLLTLGWRVINGLQAWDNDGNNKAPKPGANITVEDGDATYQTWLGGKPYIARKNSLVHIVIRANFL